MFDTDFENAAVVSLERVEERKRSRLPTINMFYYTYISYDDYTILIHSFNCPAIKQVFLFFSPHLIIIINLLLLNIITHLVESSRFVVLVNHHWIVNFYVLRVFLFGSFSFRFFFFFSFFLSTLISRLYMLETFRCSSNDALEAWRITMIQRDLYDKVVFCGVFFLFFIFVPAHTLARSIETSDKKKKTLRKKNECVPGSSTRKIQSKTHSR